LPDPFLSFKASAASSSTKAEEALVLMALDRAMISEAGRKSAPPWATTLFAAKKSPEQLKWETKFRARWGRMTPYQRQRRYQAADLSTAERQAWERLRERVQFRSGRRELRAGLARFTTSEIISLLPPLSNERATVEGAMHGKALNPISLPRWLKDHLVDAPMGGRVLRSGNDRKKLACFWIEAR
jgi:hypothetical protein